MSNTKARTDNNPERGRILIVDDSATVRKSFSRLLCLRYDCYEAQNVNEAFDQLKKRPIDLVITDVIMPGLSGVELLRKVMDIYPHTAVIVVSGVDRPQRALDAVRLGAFDYLIKPCDPDVLELTVSRALERRSLLMNAAKYKADLEARNKELVQGKAELQRLQAQIVQNEKMASLGQLAAGIAHEINNPVGFIYGNLDLLSDCVNDILRLAKFYDDAELPIKTASEAAYLKSQINYEATVDDLTGIIADCRTGVERVRDIVQNLRTFSRLDEAEFKNTEIHEGIDSTIRLLSRYFSGGNIRLVRDYGDVPAFDAFSGQLNQVWMNLLVNAAQSIGTDYGEVRIVTKADEESILVSITDTGCGIDDANLNRIFDPFFTTKPVGDGSGLGLSIAFGIVERHGGSIDVDTKLGKGTSFTVSLPRRSSTSNLAYEAVNMNREVNRSYAV